jgi:hypothetical protein
MFVHKGLAAGSDDGKNAGDGGFIWWWLGSGSSMFLARSRIVPHDSSLACHGLHELLW